MACEVRHFRLTMRVGSLPVDTPREVERAQPLTRSFTERWARGVFADLTGVSPCHHLGMGRLVR